jgi:tetratricopeptide (TPR) repeat protein
MELAPGRILNHRYQITRQLAKGGFGQTYLAQDLHLPNSDRCAIKQFKPVSNHADTIATARRLFANEAKILHDLGNHAQIPRLFAYFEEDGEFFLVQEYIEGEDLAAEIDRGIYRGNEQSVLALLVEILEILDFVHRKNVIHRDVNPYNLIRRYSDGKLVLIDFGAVKQVTTSLSKQGQTVSTIAIGTPGYYPSEQAHGHPRKASDIYAVGTIALQALTGQTPQDFSLDPRTGELSWQPLVTTGAKFNGLLDRMIRYDFRERYADASEALAAGRQLYQQTYFSGTPTQVVPPRAPLVPKILPRGVMILGSIGAMMVLVTGYQAFSHWKTVHTVSELYERGNTLYELKRYSDALVSYREALKIDPENADAWKGQGDTNLALKKYPQALANYEKAIELTPDSWQAWLGRGQALERFGKKTEALDSFDRSLELNSSAWEAWWGKAEVYLAREEYSAAHNALDKLLKLQPDRADFWYQKGWSLQNLDEYERAIKAYDKAVAIEPDKALAWYQRGNCFNHLQKTKEALESYTKAIQFDENLAIAHYSRGMILQKEGKIEESLSALERATKANPRYYQAWLQRGKLLHQSGRYGEAIAAYRKASKINSSKASAYIGIGNSWYRSGKYSNAIAAYQQALQRQENNPDTWKSLGESWFNLGQYDRAIESYDKALKYRPSDRSAKTRKQEFQNRKQEANKARELDKKLSPTPQKSPNN